MGGAPHSTASRREVRRHGESLTVETYEFDSSSTDEYGDDDKVQTTASPFSVEGIVSVGGSASDARNVGGTRVDYDVEILIPDDVSSDLVDTLAGRGENRPPSMVERTEGTRYLVVSRERQDNGLLFLYAKQTEAET